MYVIVYDFGTSAVKTSLFDIDTMIKMVCHASAEYGLYILENGVSSMIQKNGGMR